MLAGRDNWYLVKTTRSLAQFEAMAQRLVEGSFGRFLGGQPAPAEMTGQLLRAVEDSQQGGYVANVYQLFFAPDDLAAVDEALPCRLADVVRQVLAQSGRVATGEITVRLVADVRLRRGQFWVQALHEPEEENTTVVQTADAEFTNRVLQALDAFVIVDGRRHIALTRPLMTIGRQVENDIVVESPLVSRQHAHLRWRYGHFVLYDVGSRGGTMVNGNPVQEWVLRPGDVIMLAGRVPLIYGEGLERREELPPRPEGEQDTMVYPRSS